MVASHRGLESLGRVLTLGVTTCTLTALVFLPAILAIMRPGRDAAGDADEPDAAADAADTADTDTDTDTDTDDHAGAATPVRRRAA
jgi:predicted RND superfamily exporter protein